MRNRITLKKLLPVLGLAFTLTMAPSLQGPAWAEQAPAEGEIPADPAAVPAEGEIPADPAAAPAEGEIPADPAAAPAEGEIPADPAAAPAEGEIPADPAAAPAEGEIPADPAEGEILADPSEDETPADPVAEEFTTEAPVVEPDPSSYEVTDLSDIDPKSDYGKAAYRLLETLTSNYPSRTNEENDRADVLVSAGNWIQTQLESYGYKVKTQDYVHFNYTGTNYYTTKPGRSDKIIVIGGHYDCVDTEGCDDNGSGLCTTLELARRFADQETECTLMFAFYDNEEHGGFVGSYNFVNYVLREEGLLDDVILCINLDSIGAGDRLFAYGGDYDKKDKLINIWGYKLANLVAEQEGIDLFTLPEKVAEHPDEAKAFRTPTRINGSDHYYFNDNDIPYVYFEANLWCNDDGTGGNEDTALTCHYQTANEAFASTGGQVMHTEFDDFERLNELLPGRLLENMGSCSRIVTRMLEMITPDLDDKTYDPAKFEGETAESGTATDSTLINGGEPGKNGQDPSSRFIFLSEHRGVLVVFCVIAAAILACILLVVTLSLTSAARRGRRNGKKSSRKNNRPKD